RAHQEGSAERQQGDQASWEIYRTQRFLGLPDQTMIRNFEPLLRDAWISKLLETPSWLAILMITDIFGQTLRFNVPGPVADSNWSQRMPATIEEMRTTQPYTGIMQSLSQQILQADR
ncbi:MAG: 4-alpha-glucanotransferase, partial [Verrucomicrobiota bacterium]